MELTTEDLETFDAEQVAAKLVTLQPFEAAELVRSLPQAVRHIALVALQQAPRQTFLRSYPTISQLQL